MKNRQNVNIYVLNVMYFTFCLTDTAGVNMPYVEFAIKRTGEDIAVVGTIFSQHTKSAKNWEIDAELMNERKFKVLCSHFVN